MDELVIQCNKDNQMHLAENKIYSQILDGQVITSTIQKLHSL